MGNSARAKAMSELKPLLDEAGLSSLELKADEQRVLEKLLVSWESTFENACKTHPDKRPSDMALGTLTKAQMELASSLETQSDTLHSMNEIIEDSVGKEHAQKFRVELPTELTVCTKVWLMLQGYLLMDFSLANDHAARTAEILTGVTDEKPDAIRTECMRAFYIGKSHNPHQEKTSWGTRISGWLNHYFGKQGA
ncbi:conserved hypothetical protein [Vibrio nigripulchritudo SOn1]|uniref:Uncharacterized protein n=2 Tax=Vibrio nigripulchritudo TaxID=28173 RepID=A0AAV2VID2_9VIBR|nr:conserved hypothetical protein [Vibrio nigripulchritudo SOn1]